MIDSILLVTAIVILMVDVILTFLTNRNVFSFLEWKSFVDKRLDDLLSNAGKTFLNLSERMDKIEGKQK